MNLTTTRLASISDLDHIVPLFDAYRQFYGQAPDLTGARDFISQRLMQSESFIFLALQDDQVLGFTQLYPSFSSVSMAKVYVLNDLFVTTAGRGQGVGTSLLRAAAGYGKAAGAIRLNLNTDIQNTTAQSVYEAAGWVRDKHYYMYQLDL